jgi:2'-hydroxyisoflavone reductase
VKQKSCGFAAAQQSFTAEPWPSIDFAVAFASPSDETGQDTRRGAVGAMRLTRRAFGASVLAFSAACSASVPPPRRKLKLLVLGGTSFLGPQIVEAALRDGHEVTLFNRGKTNPHMFPALELIRGDRDFKTEDLSGLSGDRRWDAVIDVWPADFAMSQRTGELLKARVGRYVYVSSISAYTRLTGTDENESYPLITSSPDPTEYGYCKAETERRLQAIYGGRFSSVRPPPILGWRNDSVALSFWAVRMARGGDVIGVGDDADRVQFTDVKDVGQFVVRIAERDLPGPFNVVGPARPLLFHDFLKSIRAATGNRANIVWMPYDFLASQGIKDFWVDLPLYRPLQDTKSPGFYRISSARAIAAGMTFRPLEETVADELRWFPIYHGTTFDFGGVGMPKDTPYWLRGGIPRAKELALINAWKQRSRAG